MSRTSHYNNAKSVDDSWKSAFREQLLPSEKQTQPHLSLPVQMDPAQLYEHDEENNLEHAEDDVLAPKRYFCGFRGDCARLP